MNRTKTLAAMILIGMMPLAAVAGTVSVKSNAPAQVYFDGVMMGAAPMAITQIVPGMHTVSVVQNGTNLAQAWNVTVGTERNRFQSISAVFPPAAAPVAVAQPVYVQQPVAVAQPVYVQQPVLYSPPPVVSSPVVVFGGWGWGHHHWRW